MKKLLLSAAFVLAGLAAFAQDNKISFTSDGTAYAYTGDEVEATDGPQRDAKPPYYKFERSTSTKAMTRTNLQMTIRFHLPPGTRIKPGKYPLVSDDKYSAKAPSVYVKLVKMLPDNVYSYASKAATDGVVEVTSFDGEVIVGTFSIKLPYETGTPVGTFKVEKGAFRMKL